MKILTLAASAETLGWEYCFTTRLETAAPVEYGILEGDLIVRGSGDPSINGRNDRASAVIDEWANALKAAGIVRIGGAIVGDDDAFDDQGSGPAGRGTTCSTATRRRWARSSSTRTLRASRSGPVRTWATPQSWS